MLLVRLRAHGDHEMTERPVSEGPSGGLVVPGCKESIPLAIESYGVMVDLAVPEWQPGQRDEAEQSQGLHAADPGS